jgi:hypothetical protein
MSDHLTKQTTSDRVLAASIRFLDWAGRKTRVVECSDGLFRPQFWTGLTSGGWAFLNDHADTTQTRLQIVLRDDDPAMCARFGSEQEAAAFLARFEARMEQMGQEDRASEVRKREGIGIRRRVL